MRGGRPIGRRNLIIILRLLPGSPPVPRHNHLLVPRRRLRRVVDLDSDGLRDVAGVGRQLLVDDARGVAWADLSARGSGREMAEGRQWLRDLFGRFNHSTKKMIISSTIFDTLQTPHS